MTYIPFETEPEANLADSFGDLSAPGNRSDFIQPRKLCMTTTYKLKDFFDTSLTVDSLNLVHPRNELVEKIAEDFEFFLNHTEMGKNFALQLTEARDGNQEKTGIGKIYLTEHNAAPASGHGDVAFQTQLTGPNGQTSTLISISSSFLDLSPQEQSLVINVKGEAYPFSPIEIFLHELKHAIDITYVELQREKSPLGVTLLHEYDAINFAASACDAIENAKNKTENNKAEATPQRDPFLYGVEADIAGNHIPYESTHQEARTAMTYRILAERGLDKEADQLLDTTQEVVLGYTIGAKEQTFRDMVREEKHDTKIAGESVKWPDVVQSNNSRSERNL